MSLRPIHLPRQGAPAFLLMALLFLIPSCRDQSVTEPDHLDQVASAKPPIEKVHTLIAFTSTRDGDPEIYVMEGDGSDQRRLTVEYGWADDQAALSPNGTRIAFRSARGGNSDIYVMNVDGTRQTRLTSDPGWEGGPAWSPDGRKIAFLRQTEISPGAYGPQIFIMEADGSAQTQLTHDIQASRPSWSPDGRWIAFVGFPATGGGGIYKVMYNGFGMTALKPPGEEVGAVAWSPTGDLIAFVKTLDGQKDIWVINSNGTGETRLTTDPANDEIPAWSPDGTRIVFQSRRSGHFELWVMNADGSGQAQLTNSEITLPRSSAENVWPSWARMGPADESVAEALIGQAYWIWWSGTQLENPAMGLSVAAEELTSSWLNFAMYDLSKEPRQAYDNTPAYAYRAFNEAPWYRMYVALSAVYDGIRRMQQGDDLGGPGTARYARAMAFAKYAQGLAHGWLALMFDRAFILDESVDLDEELTLHPYTEVMATAVQELEAAIAIADANTFTLPDTWINGGFYSSELLSQLAHSHIARMMTQVARTPEERAAVDWGTVLDHVQKGIQHTPVVIGDGYLWYDATKWYGTLGTAAGPFGWARADYKTIGALDTSGNFAAWLAATLPGRTEVLITTPDTRITTAGDPTGAGLNFSHVGPSWFKTDRGTYHFSFYGHHRYLNHSELGGASPIRHITTSEMQLIKAEGLLRMGGPSQQVADIINASRVVWGQLPPALASESAADLMDKIIYEKRIEGFIQCGGCAFFDRRGFGSLAPTGPDFHHGLVEGTPLHFPIPGRELERLGLPYYTFGGVGNEMVAGGGMGAAGEAAHIRARELYRFDPKMGDGEKLDFVRRQLRAGPEVSRR